MDKHPMRDLIVLLPGILGSSLTKDNKRLWGFSPGAITRALFTLGDSIAERLLLAGDDPVRDALDDGIIADAILPDLHLLPGLWKIDGYGAVSETIQARFDVKEGENFFHFPYDWRRFNSAAAHRLQRMTHDWLARWRTRSPQAKLILVAHSMGGIVSRYFLVVLGGWLDTKALITFGTPYRGSLNALDTLSNGVRKGPLKLDHMTAFTRSCNSTYELLPIYEAYDPGTGKPARVGECEGIPGVDAARAKAALKFHHDIISAVNSNLNDPAYQRGRYRVFPVVGLAQDTRQSARIEGGVVRLEQALEGEDMSGDGTVPRVSAIPHENKDGRDASYVAMKHGSLQNTRTVLEHVEGAITSLYLDLGKFLAPDRCGQLSLSVEDVYFEDEPIIVAVEADADRLPLTVSIEDTATGAEILKQPLKDNRDGSYAATCRPLSAGSYRVRVSGDNSVAPICDAIGISPRV